jgi:hypothetical protein
MLLPGLHPPKGVSSVGFDSMRWNNTRIFLIECTALKAQMSRLCAEAWEWLLKLLDNPELAEAEREDLAVMVALQRLLYERIVKSGLPHYYWCLEIPNAITDAPSSDSDAYHYYVFDSAQVVSTDIEYVCLNCAHAGRELWKRLTKRGLDMALLRRYNARLRTPVIVQPFTLLKRVVPNP